MNMDLRELVTSGEGEGGEVGTEQRNKIGGWGCGYFYLIMFSRMIARARAHTHTSIYMYQLSSLKV